MSRYISSTLIKISNSYIIKSLPEKSESFLGFISRKSLNQSNGHCAPRNKTVRVLFFFLFGSYFGYIFGELWVGYQIEKY